VRVVETGKADDFARRATVALITALPQEEVAMKAMLDDVVSYSAPGNAPGEYHLGTVPAKNGGVHVVVLARCSMGENLATANTTILFERFPRLEAAIIVGIAGAVPNADRPEHDVRLGDIVVSGPQGVIQYDLVKELVRDGAVETEARHPPRPPSARLVQAAGDLTAKELEGIRPWEDYFKRADKLPWAARPRVEDVLHDLATPQAVVQRASRDRPGLPRVFHGTIASGNKLLKNAKLRERLRTSFAVKAVEMEAAGVADAAWLQHAGYFVVRGTCDYCDDFKEDAWQGYAAMVAAAYARALLEATPNAGTLMQEPAQNPAVLPPMVPKTLVESLRKEQHQPHAHLLCDLATLGETAGQLEAKTVDAAWPMGRSWSRLTSDNLEHVLETLTLETPLSAGEQLLLAAWPAFTASINSAFIGSLFSRDEGGPRDGLGRLFRATPIAADLLDRALPEDGVRLVLRWSLLRLLDEHRRAWSDHEIRVASPDVPFARWIAADACAKQMLRAVAGSMRDFLALPEVLFFRFGEDLLEVRWRLLACILSLAELRVLGAHLLTNEVVEHIAQLPDVTGTVEEQFRHVTVSPSADEQWTIRAVCEEPVMDYAVRQIATTLNDELRTRRAAMSDYFVRVARRGFPTVVADVYIATADTQPRYSTPPVLFTLSPNHARKLFMGTDLWGDPAYAYRELFQNALDACRYRKARSAYMDIPYEPFIRMHHGRLEDGTEFVECEDNGIGMHRELVASCFAAAGRRFVDTDEFRKELADWSTRGIEININSQFGIGIFSYFLLAERLEIETARLGLKGEPPSARLLIHIPTSSSFFRIVSISEDEARSSKKNRATERGEVYSAALDAGTRVRLAFKSCSTTKSTIGSVTTGVDAIRRNVRFSEVRTVVTDYRGERFELENDRLAWESTMRAGSDVPAFWWRTDVGHMIWSEPDAEVVTTFRSRRNGPKKRPSYGRPGCVLVDGILTDVLTPGFLINLVGMDTPDLSLDRRKIRSDIREVIETSVSAALEHLPDPVPEGLLNDLWLYDPRVCHRAATMLLRDRRTWLRQEISLLALRHLEDSVRPMTVGYVPRLDRESHYGLPDYRESLVELWRIAHDTPNAMTLDPLVLQDRGIADTFRRKLKFVPPPVWRAWSALEFGVPEIVALDYGVDDRKSVGVLAYMSWLSGEDLRTCRQRLAALGAFLDFARTLPDGLCDDAVVSDFDAWVLGHGDFEKSWAGPTIVAEDVIEYSARSGKATEDAIADFRGVAERIGYVLDFDAAVVGGLGTVTGEEGNFASQLRRYAGYGGGRWGVDDARAEHIARILGVPCPPKERDDHEAVRWEDKDRVLVREIGRAGKRHQRVDLAALCSISSAVEKPLEETAAAVSTLAPRLGLECTWTEQGLAAVLRFSESDWLLAQATEFFMKRVRPQHPFRLAAKLAQSPYAFGRQTPEEVHARTSQIYALFGWGECPLAVHQVGAALKLGHHLGKLLDTLPTDGALTIPRVVFACVASERQLSEVAGELGALALFGIRSPIGGDSYLGVSWEDMLAETKPPT